MFPDMTTVNAAGHLEVAGVDLVELAGRFGTPLYVYNEDLIRGKCRLYREALHKYCPGGTAAYAGKAFTALAMYRLVHQEGLSLDVVSGGELYTALQAGFPMDRVYFHGNNKSDQELAMAVEAGVGRVVVDSLAELERLEQAAAWQRRVQPILLRVRPGVSGHTHHFIQTGQEDSKFGLGVSDGQALAAVRQALELPHLDLKGLHCHIGSQILDTRPFCLAAGVMMDLLQKARRTTAVTLEELNLGGGLGVRYTAADRPCPIDDFVQLLARVVREKAAEHNFPWPKLTLEPGRSIVGEAGLTVYTIGTVKELPGLRTYAAVDGGMTDNLRVALYGGRYEAALANRPGEAPAAPVTIAGKACESGDILIKDLPLPLPRPGDILVVFTSGAYHFSMFSQYNRHLRPGVVFISQGRAVPVVRRETYEDLLRLDLIPPHLQVAYNKEVLKTEVSGA